MRKSMYLISLLCLAAAFLGSLALSFAATAPAAFPEANLSTANPMLNYCADVIGHECCMEEFETECDCRNQTSVCDRWEGCEDYGAWLAGDTFEVYTEETVCICKYQCYNSEGGTECVEDEDCEEVRITRYGCPITTSQYIWGENLCASP